MRDLNVYVANLGKYNEGELVGAWFSLPINIDEVGEKIGLSGEYEEYAIHDYELPLDIPEYISLTELNRMAELLEELPENIYNNLDVIMSEWFNTVDEVHENVDNICFYSGCSDMTELARHFVEEEGMFAGEVSEKIYKYIDYNALGRDIDLEGAFIIAKNGILALVS